MPVRKVGPNSYQWGNSGKVYTGKNAKAKAERQGRAIYASGYRGAAETTEGNFSGTMEPHISYEVSFSSSLPMDEDYDYDDHLIQDYVEELIRDDGSRKGIQSFEFVMGSGWYSGALIDGTVTWWTGNYSAETFEADYSYGLGDYYEEDKDSWEHKNKYKIRHRVRDSILKMPADKAWEYIIWIDSQDGAISEEENEAWETALANKDLEAALQNLIIERGYIDEGWGTGIINELKDNNYYQAEYEAPSYGSYYGACLLPDGSCTETSLDMCRSLGGRFQGPGTSCYPDAGWARPRVMQAESTSSGLGKGFIIGVVAGIVSGLVTTVFGTVISEILLDRLREDPELEITEVDPGTNTPPL